MFGDQLELHKLGNGHPDVLNVGYIRISDVDGKLGYICRTGFGMNEAEVICRHLGYTHGVEAVMNTYTYGRTPYNYNEVIRAKARVQLMPYFFHLLLI